MSKIVLQDPYKNKPDADNQILGKKEIENLTLVPGLRLDFRAIFGTETPTSAQVYQFLQTTYPNATTPKAGTILLDSGTGTYWIILNQHGSATPFWGKMVTPGGGGGGTSDYSDLTHKPQINSVELDGNKTFEDLGLEALSEEQMNALLTLID